MKKQKILFYLFIITIIGITFYLTIYFIKKNKNIVIPNNFHLEEYKYLFFDIFIKNGDLYLICPVYSNIFDSSKIKIFNKNKELQLNNRYYKYGKENTDILIYNLNSNNFKEKIIVYYNSQPYVYLLKNNKTCNNIKLALTTLFKDDFQLINIFYEYYKIQGVDHFFLYYNGKITDEIKKLYNKPDITLIEWNYQYWQPNHIHHAQTAQMHHALYKYGKQNCEYMLFCDLDEYVNLPKNGLKMLIKNNPETGVFCFNNKWSSTFNKKIPNKFPDKFYTSEELTYNDRSKCLYKINNIELLGIHSPYKLKNNTKQKLNLSMFHFFNWTKNKRDKKTDILVASPIL